MLYVGVCFYSFCHAECNEASRFCRQEILPFGQDDKEKQKVTKPGIQHKYFRYLKIKH